MWISKKVNTWLKRKLDSFEFQFAFVHRPETLTRLANNSCESGVSAQKYCENEIIVSLTTYGKRYREVYLAIESIMQQNMKPNRIILWLGEELRNTIIPLTLQNQQRRGLEIRYCKDSGPHTKLIPALQAFPDAAIITIDDDALYSFSLIEDLFNAYKTNGKNVYGTRTRRITLLKNGRIANYKQWTSNDAEDASCFVFPTGVGGVLYPPGCFNKEVFNSEVYTKICRYADDVWFKAMALCNNTKAQKVYVQSSNNGQAYFDNKANQDFMLAKLNIDKSMNDIQIKAVFDKYNLHEKLKE